MYRFYDDDLFFRRLWATFLQDILFSGVAPFQKSFWIKLVVETDNEATENQKFIHLSYDITTMGRGGGNLGV